MGFTYVRCPACNARNRISHTANGRPRCGTCKHDLPWLDEVSGHDFGSVIGSSPLPTLVDRDRIARWVDDATATSG